MTPRLLTLGKARLYLSGLHPSEIDVAPVFVRGKAMYDKALIDRKVDGMSGIAPSSDRDDPDTALQSWITSHGAAAGRS